MKTIRGSATSIAVWTLVTLLVVLAALFVAADPSDGDAILADRFAGGAAEPPEWTPQVIVEEGAGADPLSLDAWQRERFLGVSPRDVDALREQTRASDDHDGRSRVAIVGGPDGVRIERPFRPNVVHRRGEPRRSPMRGSAPHTDVIEID